MNRIDEAASAVKVLDSLQEGGSMQMDQSPQPGTPGRDFDPRARFVRLRRVRNDGFIEFDFANGEPELSVELIMQAAAYSEFCRANDVVHLNPLDGAHGGADSAVRASD